MGKELSIKTRGDRRLGRVKQMLIDIESVKCSACDGDGDIEKVVWHPHNFDRDIGCESSTKETCEECGGDGRIELCPTSIDF